MIVAEHNDSVQPEWLDANGHMNLAYYVVVFDRGTDAWLDLARMGEAYRALGNTVFAVETHTLYRRELRRGEAMTVRTWLIGADPKRIHLAHEMIADGEMVAMQEVLFVHVSLKTRRVTPLAADAAGRMAALTGEAPDWAGRRIGLPDKTKASAIPA